MKKIILTFISAAFIASCSTSGSSSKVVTNGVDSGGISVVAEFGMSARSVCSRLRSDSFAYTSYANRRSYGWPRRYRDFSYIRPSRSSYLFIAKNNYRKKSNRIRRYLTRNSIYDYRDDYKSLRACYYRYGY